MPRLCSQSLFQFFSGITLAVSLWVAPVQASVENALDPIPKDPRFVATLQTELEPWGYFVQRLLELGQSEEIKALLASLEKKGLDLGSDVLPILGSHLSVAGYADELSENKNVQLLFSIDLSSDVAAQALLDKLQKLNDSEFGVKTESHEGHTFLLLSEKKNQKPAMLLGLVVSGQNLLISAAPDSTLLKRALAAQGSRSGNVMSQAGFHKTFQRFKRDPLWGWVDNRFEDPLLQALGQISTDNPFKQGPALQTLWAGTGFGLKPAAEGLSMQFYTPLAQNIPAEWQNFYAQWAAPASPPLKNLLNILPSQPLLVMGGQKLNRYTDLGFFPEGPSQASQEMKKLYTELASTWKELLPVMDVGLDLKKDILPHLDGRYGVVLDVNPAGLPQVLAYVGVKPDSQAKFAPFLRDQFKLDPALLNEFVGASTKAKTSSVKANMHSLQVMVETHGVDWGGMYPESVATIKKEAQAASYWLDLTNPVNQTKGIGLKKALLDYKTYKNFKPQVSFSGMVFYEPLGKSQYGKDCKCKLYPAYRIYGYSPEGELWMMQGGDNGLSMAKVADKLPALPSLSSKPIVFDSQPITYQNQSIYRLKMPSHMQSKQLEAFQPGFVQLGEFGVMGSNLGVLKQAIEQFSAKQHLGQNPLYASLQNKLKQPESDFLIYLDGQKLQTNLAQLTKAAPDSQAVLDLVAPFQGFLMQWNQETDAVTGQIEVPMDMNKVDFQALQKTLMEIFSDFAEERAQESSVKANEQ